MRLLYLTILLLIIGILPVSVHAQSTRITLKMNNVPVNEVLNEIEKKSDYTFLVNQEFVDVNRKVDVVVTNEKISDILKQVFEGTDAGFSLSGKQIVLTSRKVLDASSPKKESGKVSGTARDSKGKVLPYVTVLVKGTDNGAVTDINGVYSIQNLPENATLVFSFIGFQSQEIPVENQAVINVTMSESVTGLNEVVVIGYGTVQKKDLTTAVSVVKIDDIDKKNMSNLTQAIEGKVAGVRVTQASGDPTGNFSIQVRGATSITSSNNPLYVVDGMATDDIHFLNPADIESMQILKDASSCAIYGARAANGVVLITTKRGKAGSPLVTLNATYGISNVTKKLDLLNSKQLVDLINDERLNAGLPIAANLDTLQADNDWQDIIYGQAVSSNLQLAFSGGNEKTRFYASINRFKNEGVIDPSSYERTTFKINLDHEMYSWLSFGTNVNISKSKSKNIKDNATINEGGTVLGALSTPSFVEQYTEEGYFGYNPFDGQANPLSSMYGSNSASRSNNLLGNMFAKITLTPYLSFKSSIGVDADFTNYDNFTYVEKSAYAVSTGGGADANSGQGITTLFENILDYNQKFGKHAISSVVGMTAQKYEGENTWLTVRGFPNSSVQTLNAASTATNFGSQKYGSALLSYLGRVSYAFDDKYLVSVNFRRDGSSKFGANEKYGNFPSVSAGWRMSSEPFMQGLTAVTDLKVRVSYGLTGNQNGIDNYAHISKVGLGALYPFSGSVISGYYPLSLGNESLKWESTKQTDIGVDLTMFDSRLTIIVDAYLKQTSDALLDVNLPLSTGFPSGIQNFAKIENKGLEFEVITHNTTGDLKWTTDANISLNRNKVVQIAGGSSAIIYTGDIIRERGYVTTIREGHPMSEFYGFQAAGVNPETGDLDYVKADGTLGSYLEMDADLDRVVIGNPNPDFIYGITNTFSYQGFNLSVLLQGVYGNEIFNATRLELEAMEGYKNASVSVLDRWQNPGDITDMPRAVFAGSINSEVSTRFVEDGSYLRVKNVTLSYDFKNAVLRKLQISNLNVFVSAQNLLTFTKYTGYDPEVSVSTNPTSLGVDAGTYPNVRGFTFGLNVAF
ncbi:MAG: TonB-dependent receptor [Lentimicrobium sp.]|jgi:TonB-linked SusC/RagA family outer membrane protein|nr:TonB-dependent receptor [Lentimicrobium sp.]